MQFGRALPGLPPTLCQVNPKFRGPTKDVFWCMFLVTRACPMLKFDYWHLMCLPVRLCVKVNWSYSPHELLMMMRNELNVSVVTDMICLQYLSGGVFVFEKAKKLQAAFCVCCFCVAGIDDLSVPIYFKKSRLGGAHDSSLPRNSKKEGGGCHQKIALTFLGRYVGTYVRKRALNSAFGI